LELIKGVPGGSYTKSRLNKQYAADAVKFLRESPSLADDPDRIWRLVVDDADKVENSQMDVVIALWQQGLIAPRVDVVEKVIAR
jgi:hypothetical protein